MTSTTTMTLADLKAQEKAAKKAEKERQKRIDADEKAERKRAAKTGFPTRRPDPLDGPDHRVRDFRGLLPLPVCLPDD